MTKLWIGDKLHEVDDDVADEIDCLRAGQHVQAAAIKSLRAKNERLEAAVRRSLNWLSSYPGGGAIGAWEQAHEALETFKLPTKGDDQKATQGPYVPGQERSGKSPETKSSEPTYPCDDCGAPRTKAQGGEIFTVCDECWDKRSGLERDTK